MHIRLLAPITVALLALSGCAADGPVEPMVAASELSVSEHTVDGPAAELLTVHGLDRMTTAELIDTLDATAVADRPADLMATVHHDELHLTDLGTAEAVTVPIAREEIYVSVAPYVEQTHECFYHSLTTCLGELSNERMHLTLTDDETGEVLLDEEATTFDNGFVGLWLPPDIAATLTVTFEDRSGTIPVTTGPDSPTCLTTLRLT